jgi:hypothetical protein
MIMSYVSVFGSKGYNGLDLVRQMLG